MEFLIRNFDSTNLDLERDRMGCRKRGMCDQICDDGVVPWDTFTEIKLPKFVVIKVPGLTSTEMDVYQGLRKVWQDNLDYEVTAQNANQGWYDVRVFETAVSPSGLNAIIGNKATKIQGYLSRWGCINIVLGSNQIVFRFRLSAAVQSQEFWDISAEELASISFSIDSYLNGVGTITATVPQYADPNFVKLKIIQRGGTIISDVHPVYTFTIERGTLLQNFRNDLKRKAQKVYMYQQHRINQATMDAAVAAGGTLTMTKAYFLASIRDMAAE